MIFTLFRWYQQQAKMARQIDEIHRAVIRESVIMASTGLEALREQVERSTTVQRSAIAMIMGLSEQIRELAGHPSQQEMQALADQLAAHAEELATAIAQHEGEKNGEPDEKPPGEDEDAPEPEEASKT